MEQNSSLSDGENSTLRHTNSLEEYCEMAMLLELWGFLSERKKLWMVPILLVMLMFGLLMIAAQSSAVAPFIYTLF